MKFGIVTSPFSRARVHPVTGILKRHGGTDFAAPRGSPIYALADGRIKRRSQDQANGKYVALSHSGVYETMYLHMSRFAEELKIGDAIRQGQVIGYVGATGLATGPHVCLRFRKDGREVDFLRHRDDRVVTNGTSHADSDFFRRRDSLSEVLDGLRYELLF